MCGLLFEGEGNIKGQSQGDLKGVAGGGDLKGVGGGWDLKAQSEWESKGTVWGGMISRGSGDEGI